MSDIILQRSPFPSSFFRQTATIFCTAFSQSTITSFWSPTPELAKCDTPEEIPALRLERTTREHAHRELLDPRIVMVVAIIDDEIAGVAIWIVPKPLARSETLAEIIYRKSVQYKDALEDWMWPAFWVTPERRAMFTNALTEAMDTYLGKGKIDEMWYLKILAIHPNYQRRGVGAVLMDWGLTHARQRGEKVYLEASEKGKGLYIKKGFKVVGHIDLQDGEKRVTLPCMVWDPVSAPSEEQIAQVKGKDLQKAA